MMLRHASLLEAHPELLPEVVLPAWRSGRRVRWLEILRYDGVPMNPPAKSFEEARRRAEEQKRAR